jgi:hypothetical protein
MTKQPEPQLFSEVGWLFPIAVWRDLFQFFVNKTEGYRMSFYLNYSPLK